MKKLIPAIILGAVGITVLGQGLNVSWNRFNAGVLGYCQNPYPYPSSVTGLVWHLDAALNVTNSSGVAPANNDAITNWSDVANGQKFTMFDTASQPHYNSTGTNSHPSIFFANSPSGPPSDFLTNYSGTTYNQTNTAFFVCTAVIPPASAYGQEILDSGASGRVIMQVNNANSKLGIYGGSATIEGAAILGTGTTAWFVWTGQWSGANSSMRTNGVAYVTGNAGTDAFVGFTLGCANGAFVGNGWSGDIAEAWFFHSPMGTNDMRTIENYLMGKYCIPVPP